MELWHFGQNDEKERERVQNEVIRVVLGEETCQEEKNYGNNSEKLLCGRELHALIELLPLGQIPSLAFIHGHPWRSFRHMKQEKVSQVVNGVSKCPCPSSAEPWVNEKQEMKDDCDYDISRPCSFGVQPGMIGVETSGSFADDHGDSLTKSAWRMKGRHGNSLNWQITEPTPRVLSFRFGFFFLSLSLQNCFLNPQF